MVIHARDIMIELEAKIKTKIRTSKHEVKKKRNLASCQTITSHFNLDLVWLVVLNN